MERKTIEQIVDETIEYYNNNPRAVNANGSCRYLTEDGRKCAYSRCCKDSTLLKPYEGTSINSSYFDDDKYEEFLKDEYKGYSRRFWVNIQLLHDGESYWRDGKITETGLEYAKYIKENF